MRYPVALKQNVFCYLAAALMAASAVLRCAYFLPRWSQTDVLMLTLQFFLPLLSSLIYCGAMLAKGGKLYLLTVLSVFLGVTFFIVKAQGFEHVWHTILCTLLYLAVFMIYTLTSLGVMPSLLPQKLVFGLPLIFFSGTFALARVKTGCQKEQ